MVEYVKACMRYSAAFRRWRDGDSAGFRMESKLFQSVLDRYASTLDWSK